MKYSQVKRFTILFFGSVFFGVTLLNCSVEPKEKPKSLVESQKKVLEGAKAIEAQLQEADAKRRKQMDGQ